MRKRWAAWWSVSSDALRTQLWPLPLLGVFLAVVLGAGLPLLDRRVDDQLAGSRDYLFGGGADAARTLLSSIAGSLITVTSLTFSLTVVTLQLASSQFSPRLLRTFTRDRFVHVTLALFLSTFTYALTVLRAVRSPAEARTVFVPQISVTLAFVLALASVLGLVSFLSHLAREIRVETALRTVHAEASDTVCRALPERGASPDGPPALPDPPEDAVLLLNERSGFLTAVDHALLLRVAQETGVVVLVNQAPGSSVVEGTPLGAVWSRDGEALDADRLDQLRRAVRRAVTTGYERTAAQDVGFGLRQITDVALRALSPGINDPTTAVHAIGHASALLCELAGRELGPRVVRDEDGGVRVVVDGPDLVDLVELVVAQSRLYGAADIAVASRLADLLRELAWVVTAARHRRVVAAQVARLRATCAEQAFDHEERAGLDRRLAAVDAALAGRWFSPA